MLPAHQLHLTLGNLQQLGKQGDQRCVGLAINRRGVEGHLQATVVHALDRAARGSRRDVDIHGHNVTALDDFQRFHGPDLPPTIHSADVTKHKRLKLMGARDQKLGLHTIMDRALAQKHGAVYVHAAAFAIDVDRVAQLSGDDPSLPFGWEVLLIDRYLCTFVAPRPEAETLLDDLVLSVLDQAQETRDEPPLGAQLPFAVFTALTRGALPEALQSCFRSWKKPPIELSEEVAKWLQDPSLLARLCKHCLEAKLSPPLVEPVRQALLQLAQE